MAKREDCHHCDGSGDDPVTHDRCWKCGGSGERPELTKQELADARADYEFERRRDQRLEEER
jgi:RecJ-like exonuclease